jgi:leader peptidase (prepilin peptidase)/N-methyltransferase
MAMLGGIIGWKGVLLNSFIGSLFGSVIGISLILIKGSTFGSKIPFGPYLAFGAIISLFFGQEFYNWYLHSR